MHYLIDGHNLIARTPGLSLADPDDEAKLTQLLKRWALADARRKVTVIFDAGLPAGEARHLSGGGVKAFFAPDNSSADALIIRRIAQLTNPAEHTVVSSDAAVLAAAQRRRVPTQRSEAFAVAMLNDRHFSDKDKPPAGRPEPNLSPDELQEWLTLFGPEPETKPARRPPATSQPHPSEGKPPPKKTKQEQAEEDDLDEWLRLFGYKK